VKAALREGTGDITDLQARARRASSSLAVLIGQGQERMTRRREHDVRELIALWAEVKAALEARGGTG
jgi:hypothetical protein